MFNHLKLRNVKSIWPNVDGFIYRTRNNLNPGFKPLSPFNCRNVIFFDLYPSWWTVGHLICSKYVEQVKTYHSLEIICYSSPIELPFIFLLSRWFGFCVTCFVFVWVSVLQVLVLLSKLRVFILSRFFVPSQRRAYIFNSFPNFLQFLFHYPVIIRYRKFCWLYLCSW